MTGRPVNLFFIFKQAKYTSGNSYLRSYIPTISLISKPPYWQCYCVQLSDLCRGANVRHLSKCSGKIYWSWLMHFCRNLVVVVFIIAGDVELCIWQCQHQASIHVCLAASVRWTWRDSKTKVLHCMALIYGRVTFSGHDLSTSTLMKGHVKWKDMLLMWTLNGDRVRFAQDRSVLVYRRETTRWSTFRRTLRTTFNTCEWRCDIDVRSSVNNLLHLLDHKANPC